MANLFGKSRTPAPQPTPQIDEAKQTVDENMRKRLMRGRAASMLTAAPQADVAKRTLGN